jgi:hypothetical protein
MVHPTPRKTIAHMFGFFLTTLSRAVSPLERRRLLVVLSVDLPEYTARRATLPSASIERHGSLGSNSSTTLEAHRTVRNAASRPHAPRGATRCRVAVAVGVNACVWPVNVLYEERRHRSSVPATTLCTTVLIIELRQVTTQRGAYG